MTFRLVNFRPVLAAATLGCAILCAKSSLAAEKPRGRAIEFSEPKSGEVTTNLNQLSRRDGLRQLEEDLNTPFHTFNAKSSLDGVLAPPMRAPTPPPLIQSKRVKELIERQKNWIFMSPEDFAGSPKDEDLFKMHKYDKDGQETKNSTPLERYIEKQERERNPAIKKTDLKEDDFAETHKRKDRSDEPEDPAIRGLRESEQNLKNLFDSDSSRSSLSPISPPNSFADVFGLGSPLPDKTAAENPNIAKYRQFLDSHSLAPGADPFSSLPGVTPVSASDPFSTKHESFAPGLGTMSSPATFGLPDAKSFNQVPPPRVDPPKIAPPTPSFTVPQRKFL